MISTKGKTIFIDLIDPDGKITTMKTISIRKSNIDAVRDTIRNITNFVDTPVEPKINKLGQPGNNKKYEKRKVVFLTIKKWNGERKK